MADKTFNQAQANGEKGKEELLQDFFDELVHYSQAVEGRVYWGDKLTWGDATEESVLLHKRSLLKQVNATRRAIDRVCEAAGVPASELPTFAREAYQALDWGKLGSGTLTDDDIDGLSEGELDRLCDAVVGAYCVMPDGSHDILGYDAPKEDVEQVAGLLGCRPEYTPE